MEMLFETNFTRGPWGEDELKAIIKSASTKGDLVSKAYGGLCKTMLAKHKTLPNKKWQTFKEGRDIIESCIRTKPNSAELRYIRLLVQLNAPSFLGYNSQVSEDLKFFSTNGKTQLGSKWYTVFVGKLKKSKYMNEERLKELKKNKITYFSGSEVFNLVWFQ